VVETQKCKRDADVCRGTGETDYIFGSNGPDKLRALGGDYAEGRDGDDTLGGGTGDDRLRGSLGRDSLTGQEGADQLYGQLGPDRLSGGAGRNVLRGGPGDDRINAVGQSVDDVECGRGKDWANVGEDDIVNRRTCEVVIRQS
jgi:Ca2+-binding RTX toxin-like protein